MASSKGGAKKFYHTTIQQAYYMRPSEAKVVSLEGARPVDDAQKVRLGIVSMTKRPADLEQWLAYHRRVVGVEKFFLQIEDTPELAALLLRPPWNGCVDATFVAKTHRDYFVQMDRQAVNVACAVERAKAHGIEWLLHVDDDEMLHCPAGAGAMHAALSALPPQCCDAHIKNLEALAPAPTCSKPFEECVTFVASTSKFASYTNGKVLWAGRCARFKGPRPAPLPGRFIKWRDARPAAVHRRGAALRVGSLRALDDEVLGISREARPRREDFGEAAVPLLPRFIKRRGPADDGFRSRQGQGRRRRVPGLVAVQVGGRVRARAEGQGRRDGHS